MGKIIVSEFITLDGVMEGPGPADSFVFGGWSSGYEDKGFLPWKLQELFAADALLIGRITYDGFAEAWPGSKDDVGFADKMNNLPKYVVSATLSNPKWNNTKVINKNVVKEVQKLKDSTAKDILVYGSANLSQTLFDNHLVDEVNLVMYPVVLGQGKKLFKDKEHFKLHLLEASTFQPEAILLRYAVR